MNGVNRQVTKLWGALSTIGFLVLRIASDRASPGIGTGDTSGSSSADGMDSEASWPNDQARTTVVSLPGEVSHYSAVQVREEV